MASKNIEQVNSVEDYLKKLEKYFEGEDGLYFRGQSGKYSEITSSISRNIGHLQNETKMYRELIDIRKEEFEKLQHPFDYLDKFQRYGCPTRLIDLTVNPLIALYFAVENIEEEESGRVYLFKDQDYPQDDIRVKVVTTLAFTDELDIESIKSKYHELFTEEISNEEIKKYLSRTWIVTEKQNDFNKRKNSQSGTFAICGNEMEGDEITNTIVPLRIENTELIFHIPFEYKKKIKQELDEVHTINGSGVYPELPSAANYVKEKFKYEEFSYENSYRVQELEESSIYQYNRQTIKIILNKKMGIEQIKSIASNLIEERKHTADIIYVYIAKTTEDFILFNWVVQVQWLSPDVEKDKKMYTHKTPDENGHIWKFGNSTDTTRSFFIENYFKEDDVILKEAKNLFCVLSEFYKKVAEILDSTDELSKVEGEIDTINKEKLTEISIKSGDLGFSRNIDVNEYIEKIEEFGMKVYYSVDIFSRDEIKLEQRFKISRKELERASSLYVEISENITDSEGKTDA